MESVDREFLDPSFGLEVYRSSRQEGVYSPPFTKEVHRPSLSGSICARSHFVDVFFRWPYFLCRETTVIIFVKMEKTMKKKNTGKTGSSATEFQCRYCSKTIIIVENKKDEHPIGWKCITKESDEGIDNFYLCPDCMNRYRLSQAAYRNN